MHWVVAELSGGAVDATFKHVGRLAHSTQTSTSSRASAHLDGSQDAGRSHDEASSHAHSNAGYRASGEALAWARVRDVVAAA